MINKIRAKVKKKMPGCREFRMPLGSRAINEASERQGLGCYFSGQGGIQGRRPGLTRPGRRAPGLQPSRDLLALVAIAKLIFSVILNAVKDLKLFKIRDSSLRSE
jgi:hypothetical protein